jgi:hypothetical protein
MMMAAQIGPIPTMSHRVVPDAATATVTRFLDAVSRRAMSPTSSLAIMTR